MDISAVRLRNSYQVCYVDTNSLFVKQNALCIVETEHGIDIGRVAKCTRYKDNPKFEAKGKLLRKASLDDVNRIPEIEALEQKAFEACREKARGKKLDMKLVSVKALFDRTKIIFFFVSDNRVDFRELVRELAGMFRTRIEMRQIGVRDEARLVGGYGPCGRNLCCIHQREEFDPVSIKMAKEQNLNLNSLKISGMCGRLLCCLGYEYETYRYLNENLPVYGTEIIAEDKTYIVIHTDTLKETVQVKADDRIISISKYDLTLEGGKYHVEKETIKALLVTPESEDKPDDDIFSFTV
jgi:cell fate regulator YaaT (PSP1 superfamily)